MDVAQNCLDGVKVRTRCRRLGGKVADGPAGFALHWSPCGPPVLVCRSQSKSVVDVVQAIRRHGFSETPWEALHSRGSCGVSGRSRWSQKIYCIPQTYMTFTRRHTTLLVLLLATFRHENLCSQWLFICLNCDMSPMALRLWSNLRDVMHCFEQFGSQSFEER